MNAPCTFDFKYPSGFDATLALDTITPLIGHVYFLYYTQVYGDWNGKTYTGTKDGSNWPLGAEVYAQQFSGVPIGLTPGATASAWDLVDTNSLSPFMQPDCSSITWMQVPYALWATDGDGNAYLAFRGTAGFWEWAADGVILQLPYEAAVGNACAHTGFQFVWSELQTQVLGSCPANAKKLYVVGHSLGGALATLAAPAVAAQAGTAVTAYTFGSPKVGNPDFVNWYDAKVPTTYRIQNSWDIIAPIVPVMTQMGRIGIIDFGEQGYEHVAGLCPLYISLLETAEAIMKTQDFFYAHELVRYREGLKNYTSGAEAALSAGGDATGGLHRLDGNGARALAAGAAPTGNPLLEYVQGRIAALSAS